MELNKRVSAIEREIDDFGEFNKRRARSNTHILILT